MLDSTRILTVVALGTFATLAAAGAGRAEACPPSREAATPVRHLDVWPARTVAPDGVFIVQSVAGGFPEDVDAAFADLARGDVALDDDLGTPIPVRVELAEGVASAALLRPAVSLVPGHRYRLDIHGLVSTVDVVEAPVAPPVWTARAVESTPRWTLTVPFGPDGAPRILVRTTAGCGGRARTRLLAAMHGTVDVGPWLGSCPGPYQLEVAAIDDVGHLVAMPGGPLELLGTRLAPRDAFADDPPLTALAVVRLYALLLVGLGLALAFWGLAWRTAPAPPED